jgi:hypothetical protein
MVEDIYMKEGLGKLYVEESKVEEAKFTLKSEMK